MPDNVEVYQAICRVQADLAKQGIAKNQRNKGQGFNFRGIDDVLNALSALLAEHKLVIIPRVSEREVVERTTAKGTVMFYVTVLVEYQLTSAEDGSWVLAKAVGEASDTGDKATNKAMSAAYKYMAIQTFAIPTEGDNDADAHSPEPVQPARDVAAMIRRCTTLAALAATWKELTPAEQQQNVLLKDAKKDELQPATAEGAE